MTDEFLALADATIGARRATGDAHIATQAHAGLVDIVRAVAQASGFYAVTVLRADLAPADAVRYLRNMEA